MIPKMRSETNKVSSTRKVVSAPAALPRGHYKDNPAAQRSTTPSRNDSAGPVRQPNDYDAQASHQLRAEDQASLTRSSPVKGKTPAPHHAPDDQGGEASESREQLWQKEDDVAVMNKLTELREAIVAFCDAHFDFKIKGPIELARVGALPELISYVGCIAMGGPNGRDGWKQLIEDPVLRKALVYGVVSRVVHEHVVSSLFFGADKATITKLERMEKSQVEKDGFYRAEKRAKVVLAANKARVERGKQAGIMRLTLQLQKLLRPLRDLDYRRGDSAEPDYSLTKYTARLSTIVGMAVALNSIIRESGDVVYYFSPIFKDEEFDPHRMECLNLKQMQRDCPLQDVDDKGKPIEANDPRGDPTDVALIRVVCSMGCVAHRRGGGEMAKRMLEEEERRPDDYSLPPEMRSDRGKKQYYGRIITEEDGIRTRMLTKAVVALRWGKPQFEESPRFSKGYVELQQIQAEIAMAEQKPGACLVM